MRYIKLGTWVKTNAHLCSNKSHVGIVYKTQDNLTFVKCLTCGNLSNWIYDCNVTELYRNQKKIKV